MKVNRASLPVAIALGLSLILAACSTARPQQASAELLQKIENARTPADHKELVAYYEAAASEAKANADRHRKMARSYSVWEPSGRGGGASMNRHCNSIADKYDATAREYSTMATLHRQLSQQAAP